MALKTGLAVAFFAVNFFGLWPFRFVHCRSQIKYSFPKAIYSVFVLFFGMTTYFIIGSITFNSDFEIFFGSITLKLGLLIYTQFVLVSFLFVYLGQHWFAKEIEFFYHKCKDIVDTMNDSFRNVDFSSNLFEMFLRTIVIDLVQVFVSFYYMTKSTDVMASKPYLTIILMLPTLAVRLHMNIFYGAVLAINVYMRKLNCCLGDIVTDNTYRSGTHKYRKIKYNCFCSDEVDKLSTLYFKLAEATRSLNSIFSVQIAVWNLTILVTLAVQFLYQFISIIEVSLNRNWSTAMRFNVYGLTSIVISSFDLFSTSFACQRINTSVTVSSTFY